MSIRILSYCLGQGIKNFFKNRLMTMASITTITASLFVVSVFYCMAVNVDYIIDRFEQNIGIAIFFQEDVSENEIITLKEPTGSKGRSFSSQLH